MWSVCLPRSQVKLLTTIPLNSLSANASVCPIHLCLASLTYASELLWYTCRKSGSKFGYVCLRCLRLSRCFCEVVRALRHAGERCFCRQHTQHERTLTIRYSVNPNVSCPVPRAELGQAYRASTICMPLICICMPVLQTGKRCPPPSASKSTSP